MKRLFKGLALSVLITVLVAGCCNKEKHAKYVFLFIGDGMGFSHVSLTEAYKAFHETGTFGSLPLTFTQFPVLGMATTYSASNAITCSSAAGTALSTGTKTKNYLLGVDPDSCALTSISYKIHDAGYKVGIMTTVNIDHATPGAFYGHETYRNNYYNIGAELSQTGFEFFAGGDFAQPNGEKGDQKSLFELTEEAGYTISRGLEEFQVNKGTNDKHLLLSPVRPGLETTSERETVPYVIDRKDGDLTLASIVNAAIEVLNNQKGFFMMAEGGKIDGAAHKNEVVSTIFETLDMDEAVAVAFEFYKQHPDETLIVVTADHETGGVSLGARSGYVYSLNNVDSIVEAVASGESEYVAGEKTDASDAASTRDRIGWTTTSHTGGAVPVWSVGVGSEKFAGRMDNTDIPKRICEIMGVQF
ncbi:MAG: alkaline phosphatase [Bacteroidales bacterium]|nr:alkaline phosphatase [Bacteroidales bacterium]